MISAPFGCLISRICLLIFLSSPGDMPSKMPTGLRSIGAILLLEEVGEPVAQELPAGFFLVNRHELFHALIAGVGERFRCVAGGEDRLADNDLDPLAKPHVLRPREGHRDHGHARFYGKKREPLLEGQEPAPFRPRVAPRGGPPRSPRFRAPGPGTDKPLVGL